MKRPLTLILAALSVLILAREAAAYVVVLKDGSKILARAKYEVKGINALITLENGSITQIPLAKVDVPGSDEYNKKIGGNAIDIGGSDTAAIAPPPSSSKAVRLQNYIKQNNTQMNLPQRPAPGAAKAEAKEAGGGDPLVVREAARIFGADGITQYKVYAGPKVTIVAENEDGVFKVMIAAARLAQDLTVTGKARELTVDIVAVNGSDAGKFRMNAESVKDLTEGSVTASEFFVNNVIF